MLPAHDFHHMHTICSIAMSMTWHMHCAAHETTLTAVTELVLLQQSELDNSRPLDGG